MSPVMKYIITAYELFLSSLVSGLMEGFPLPDAFGFNGVIPQIMAKK